jgi:hypothetical protein
MVQEVDWIDLPSDDYTLILGYTNQNSFLLNQYISTYNQIPKDQVSTLENRVLALEKIAEFVTEWLGGRLEAIDKKKHIQWILEIAQKKKAYLIQLISVYAKGLHLKPFQEEYHQDLSRLEDEQKKSVFLNNSRFFSLKMREYWGDFWMETIDPCHRRLTPYLMRWEEEKAKDSTTPEFFLWLEVQHLPKYVPKIKHFSSIEQDQSRLVIQDGLFRLSDRQTLANFCELNKRYLFAIDLDKEMYIHVESEGISHSTFTGGKPVLGAGLLVIKEGKLVSLALESGHYLPTVEIGYQILGIFLEKGLIIDVNFDLEFFYDRNKYKASLSLSKISTFENFQDVLNGVIEQKKLSCVSL